MTATSQTAGSRAALLVAALGVVFGDIGTSPLYAFKESLAGVHGVGVQPGDVLGVLSMIFWAVTLVVSLKYVLLVLQADNDGEGGMLALLAAVLRQMPAQGRLRTPAIAFGLVGAAMFYGDSVITPAISVLSAVEGLRVVAPAAERWVLPITVAILVLLFAAQRRGTDRIGRLFGPVMLLWFITLGALGAWQIVRMPGVLEALWPLHALKFAFEHPAVMLAVMSGVFLALTGGEALYADMGHFGREPIRRAWFFVAMPCLLLNYFGQGALVLQRPDAVENPFFLLAPPQLQWPLVLLSTAATVIASQAVISGAYSLTAQAVKMGYLPRLPMLYTSKREAGQIYVPLINWVLLAAVIGVVLGFRSSSSLAAAYGLAVSTTMVVTTLGVCVVAARRWDWSPWKIAALSCLLLLDLAFLAANSLKINDGGWFPLALAMGIMGLLLTWKRGRDRLAAELSRNGIGMEPFLKSLQTYPPTRVEGTAVFLTPTVGMVPHALLHNLKHNRVMHERVILMSAESENVPHMAPESMAQVRELGDGCWAIRIRLGFQDPYDIDVIARMLSRHHDFELVPQETSFFLSRQTVVPGAHGWLRRWTQRLFGWMNRNAQPASDFFHIPPNRVIEIGTQIVL